MKVTDRMVKLARRTYESNKWDLPSGDDGFPTGRDHDAAMRAALEAALATAPVAGVDAPEPAVMASQPRPDRAEFEALLDTWYLAHRAQHVGGMAALNGEIPKDCEIQDPTDLMVHLLMEDRAARRAVLKAAGYQEGEN